MNAKFRIGNEGEKLWVDYIIKTHKDIETHPNKKFYDWDIKAKYKSKEVTYEIKYDVSGYKYATRYNRGVNLYIEYENTNKKEASGILASKADLYVYIFNDDNKNNIGYVFNRIELLNHLQESNYKSKVNKLGGDNNAKGWLATLEGVKPIARAIINLDTHKPKFISKIIKKTL
jgi:hypothetical protein